RTRLEVGQGRAADGRAAVQDAGAGPQGDLDARPGLQPDPHGHGPGGQPEWDLAASHQLQGDAPGPRSVPTTDGKPGALQPVPSRIALSGGAPGDRPTPRRRPPRPLRASDGQAQAEELRPPDEAAEADQTRNHQIPYKY